MRRLMIAAAISLSLVACSNPVPSFIVAPQLITNQTGQLSNVRLSLTVQDNRPTNGTLIMRDGDGVRSYPTSNDMIGAITQTLTGAITQKGGIVAAGEPIMVTIQINQLEANAEIKTVEHVVRNNVEISVLIDRNGSTYNKSFSARGNFSAPFKLDTAVAERELRLLVEQVLGQVMADSSWQDFVRG
jgi:uncharacterized lipoprotein YajG